MKRQRGFSMLEVLIALLIILIGVLGTAGMQLLALQSTGWSQYQSLAALLASNMATSMRNNTAYWVVNQPTTTITVTGNTVSPAITAGACLGGTCNPSQQAGFDLVNWGQSIQTALPGGTGSITCPTSTSQVTCTITITWNAIQSGMYAKGSSTTMTYSTLVGLK